MKPTATQRKKAQRERENAELAKKGGFRLTMICYGTTADAIDALCAHHGFTGKQRRAECLTHIIHEAHDSLEGTK